MVNGHLGQHQINENLASYSSALALAPVQRENPLSLTVTVSVRMGLGYRIQQAVRKTGLGILVPDNFESDYQ